MGLIDSINPTVDARDKISVIEKIANNILYLEDSFNYSTALWEILGIIEPETYSKDEIPVLQYME